MLTQNSAAATSIKTCCKNNIIQSDYLNEDLLKFCRLDETNEKHLTNKLTVVPIEKEAPSYDKLVL